MKSPIRWPFDHRPCLKQLKKIIPEQSVVWSFLFFSGELELNLAESQRFVCAHTDRIVIYEFWKCAMEDPHLICELLLSEQFKMFQHKKAFHILQESWPKYKDPYVRSAIFFLLNRHSDSGMISSGNFNKNNFNPVALSYLKRLEPQNFHLKLVKDFNDVNFNKASLDANYLLFPMGRFDYGFFEHGKSKGHEQTSVNHQLLFEKLSKLDKKWVVLYVKHPAVFKTYKDFNICMINKFGQTTTNKENCEEIIVTNF